MKKIFSTKNTVKIVLIMSLVVIFILIALFLSGCNMDVVDTHYHFDYAYVLAGNDILAEGKVEKWTDFDDGDQLQVTIDGKTYLSNSSNIILIDK